MTNRLRRLAYGLLLVSAASACDPSLTTGLAGVNVPITFSVREIAGTPDGRPADPVIVVLLEYGSGNGTAACSALETELGVSATVVTIYLAGFRAYSCDPAAITCACALVLLPRLSGDYDLRITTDERSDLYMLSVSETAITVTARHAVFTVPSFTQAWRFPESSFAAVCYTGTSDATGCDGVEHALAAIAGLTAFAFPPGGKIPFPETEDAFPGVYRASYYRYATDDAYARAGQWLRDFLPSFKTTHPMGFVYLTNWRGVYLP